jgi:hypothetical protein
MAAIVAVRRRLAVAASRGWDAAAEASPEVRRPGARGGPFRWGEMSAGSWGTAARPGRAFSLGRNCPCAGSWGTAARPGVLAAPARPHAPAYVELPALTSPNLYSPEPHPTLPPQPPAEAVLSQEALSVSGPTRSRPTLELWSLSLRARMDLQVVACRNHNHFTPHPRNTRCTRRPVWRAARARVPRTARPRVPRTRPPLTHPPPPPLTPPDLVHAGHNHGLAHARHAALARVRLRRRGASRHVSQRSAVQPHSPYSRTVLYMLAAQPARLRIRTALYCAATAACAARGSIAQLRASPSALTITPALRRASQASRRPDPAGGCSCTRAAATCWPAAPTSSAPRPRRRRRPRRAAWAGRRAATAPPLPSRCGRPALGATPAFIQDPSFTSTP